MKETFGRKLRTLRRAKGVTQRELARRVGVDFSYISKLENDRLPSPAAKTIVKIGEALDVTPEELLAVTGKMPPQLQQSIGSSVEAIRFLRNAQAMKLSDEEWAHLSEYLQRLRESPS